MNALVTLAALAVILALAIAAYVRSIARELADENWFTGGGDA